MQACVIDSCSFLHSFHIQVGDFSFSDLMKDFFEVVMHKKVADEVDSVLPRAYPKWEAKGLVTEEMSEVRRWHSEWRVDRIQDSDFEGSTLLKYEKVTHLDAGEKGCMQLARDISHSRHEFVLFFTDDYEAGETARRIFDKYQLGYVVRSADLIIFFGLQFQMSKREIHQALRDLLAFYIDEFEVVRRELEESLPGRSTIIVSMLDRTEFEDALKALRGMRLPSKSCEHLEKRIATLRNLTEDGIVAHIRSRLNSLSDQVVSG